jgi:GntR family transcriptional regulator / MocR family aminotransferase
VSDWHTALPTQAALGEFIDTGGFARHIRAMRREYRVRHHRITAILRRNFGDRLAPVDSAVGLHVAAFTPRYSGAEVADIVHRAADAGVGLYRLDSFGYDGHAPSGLLIGYGAIAPEDIEDGLRRLRSVMA